MPLPPPLNQQPIDFGTKFWTQPWMRFWAALSQVIDGFVQQDGAVTAGHLAVWAGDELIADGGPVPSSGDLTATYLTAGNESATLPNSRRLLAGTNVTFDDSVANQRTVNVADAVNYIPLALGTEPLTFVSNGAGEPVLTPYTP